jgi:hypothetical protein
MLIDSGRDALLSNKVFREFLGSMAHAPRVLPKQRAAPVAATPAPGPLQAQAE